MLVALALALQASASSWSYKYNHSIKPLANYYFHWSIEGDEIRIGVNVSTNGWVGFGVAEHTSGSMPGSDIFRAFVPDKGGAQIEDSYALEKAMPEPDKCQDWKLISAQKVNGWTMVEARRKLKTGDPQDRYIITHEASRYIFAYSATPSFGSYHGIHRIGLALNMGDGSTPHFKPTSDVKFFDIRNDHVPSMLETEYKNMLKGFPVKGTFHMISASFISASPAPNLIHHITLSGVYATGMMHYLYIWAPGVGDMVTPPECGFRLGSLEGVESFQLQTHYNNPNHTNFKTADTSGIRIYYTTIMRPQDCGAVTLGDPLATLTVAGPMPKGVSAWEFHCPAYLTETTLGKAVLTVFGSVFHMHGKGAQMWTTLNDVIQNKADFYDWGFQQMTNLTSKGFKIKAGDHLLTTCVYDTGNEWKMMGLASKEEMCINYVFYYPRHPLFSECSLPVPGVFFNRSVRSGLFPRSFANQSCHK